MNPKVSKYINNTAIILFAIGGMLLYQGNEKGTWAIGFALLIHATLRFFNLKVSDLKKLVFLEILKLINNCFLTIVSVILFFDIETVPYIFAAIIFDTLLNIPIKDTNKNKK
jgi:hypothetical protein